MPSWSLGPLCLSSLLCLVLISCACLASYVSLGTWSFLVFYDCLVFWGLLCSLSSSPMCTYGSLRGYACLVISLYGSCLPGLLAFPGLLTLHSLLCIPSLLYASLVSYVSYALPQSSMLTYAYLCISDLLVSHIWLTCLHGLLWLYSCLPI